jgi:alpha-tubulin suppressor-like RCC1 family protein
MVKENGCLVKLRVETFQLENLCLNEIIAFFDTRIYPETFSNRIVIVGELYTWGKGRYGRLGHGDSDDQLKPKLVEALLGYRVIDVACGNHF